MRLQDKVTVITGGGGGMGRATALLFAREGAAVVIGDVDRAGGASAAAAIEAAGGRAAFQPTDVSREAEVAALIALAESRFGRLDTIFNNAGVEQPVTPTREVSEALFERVIAINLKGTFFGCKHAIPALLRGGGGTIVNNASVSAYANVGGNVSYAASKGAVMSLTRVLAIEHARDNIRVNAICPVMGATGLIEQFMGMPDTPENRKKFVATIPLGRLSTPLDIARAAVYLASDDAEFITGVEFPVDGGRTV